MVLRNFVTLEPNTPAVLHFSGHRFADRDIVDPLTGVEKVIRVLDFDVDTLNGQATRATFSVTSEKLAKMLEPFLGESRYLNFNLTITKSGQGFRTEYDVQATPR
jgi:hypothetical protein